MRRKAEKPPRQVNQLTLVSTPYVSQLVRTVAHVRSIREGRTVSMAEVFRSVVDAAAPRLEEEVGIALGRKALLPLRRLREDEAASPEVLGSDEGKPARPRG